MLIGLKHGSTKPFDQDARDAVLKASGKLVSQFKEKHGTIECRELLDCDISTDEGLDRARQEELFSSLCPNFVRYASEIVEKILAE